MNARAWFYGQSFNSGTRDGIDHEPVEIGKSCPACGTNGDHYCPADVARGPEDESEEQ